MRAKKMLEAFGDLDLDVVVANLGVGGEIELDEAQVGAMRKDHIADLSMRARISAIKVRADGKGQVILTVDRASFKVLSVQAPPKPPDTEPMLDEQGRAKDMATAGEAVDAALATADPDSPTENIDSAFDIPPHPFVLAEGSEDEDPECENCARPRSDPLHASTRERGKVLTPGA